VVFASPSETHKMKKKIENDANRFAHTGAKLNYCADSHELLTVSHIPYMPVTPDPAWFQTH
jgi:hypothetical protein